MFKYQPSYNRRISHYSVRLIFQFVFIPTLTIALTPLYGFLDTQTESQWEFNIKSSLLLYSDQVGFFPQIDKDTSGKNINLFEIIDPNFLGINNFKIIGRALNFSQFYGELGYWDIFDHNLALGIMGKLYLFENGWLVTKGTYNVINHPENSTELGRFQGSQLGIGTFFAVTPTDDLLFRLQYHFSYNRYSFDSDEPIDFTLPAPHYFHKYSLIFKYNLNFEQVWNLKILNESTFKHNSERDNYFGYDADLQKFDQIFYDELRLQLTYHHYFFTWSQSTGSVWTTGHPRYFGKSIFKGEKEYQYSVYAFYPKSIPAQFALFLDTKLQTHNILNNFLNFIFSTSFSALNSREGNFITGGEVYYGLETGFVVDFGIPFFREVAILTYSYGLNLNSRQQNHLISLYLSPL